jgi:hypothetical protein
VLLEREVHFLDAVAFGRLAESGLGARRAAAEQDAISWLHGEQYIRLGRTLDT